MRLLTHDHHRTGRAYWSVTELALVETIECSRLDRCLFIQVVSPGRDHDLRLPQAVEDLPLQALVLELCSEISASLQARAMLLPCTSCTSICRSFATKGSALQFLRLAIKGSFSPG